MNGTHEMKRTGQMNKMDQMKITGRLKKTMVVTDLSTSAVKSYLYDCDSGAVLADSQVEIPLSVPETGAAETDPSLWWDGLCRTVRELLQGHDGSQVEAIAITNQQITCVFLDEDGQPVAPALLWMDTRCTEEVERLLVRCAEEGMGSGWLTETTGIPPSDSWGLAKLLWLRSRSPELYKRIRRVASVDAYILDKLCGRFVTDETNACFFHLDIRTRKPAADMLAYLNVDVELFPEVVPPGTVVGSLGPEAERQTGLPAGLTVVAAASDQPCAMLGMGVGRSGEAVVNLGTGTFVMAPTVAPLADGRMMTNISALPSQWLMMGTHYLTGGAMSWLRNMLAAAGSSAGFADLSDSAAHVGPGSDGLIFLPNLSGTGTPRWDPDARGLFANLGLHHSLGHMVRSVMESTGYGIRGILDTYAEIGIRFERIVMAGGPTASDVWRQSLADILQRPLELSPVREATPLGAAMLAAAAVGRFAGVDEAVRAWSHPGVVIHPRREFAAVYDKSYKHYSAWLDAEASVRKRMEAE
ncbi:xylulokinase [Paenibacillus beijingensis]|uniref:Carbohydrate kinase n=1 Tax=Paenibacillus beijingensis TaxID=1126833 RepID=A0A0D5NFN4_9BACL|nr:FGGY family carbohydrate kinase [Paenibacillus beijingensis]AJY74174.1 hypothetical protein VN24_05755 [Paenibacillus beijingensis]